MYNIFTRYRDEVSVKKAGGKWEIVRINRLLKDLGGVPSAEDLRSWRDERLKTIKPSSVNRELNLISAIFNYARQEWGYKLANPVKLIKRPPRGKPRKRRVAPSELLELSASRIPRRGYGSVKDYVPWIFEFAVETGMRLGEICTLRWEHVYISRNFVHVAHSKNGDERDVPLTRRARELINELHTHARFSDRVFPVGKESVGVLFRKLVKLYGIVGLHFHDSRHEAVSRLSKKLTVMELAAVVGHRDLKSLMVYYNPTAEELADKLG